MPEDPILTLAKDEVGNDKDAIITFLVGLVRATAKGVSSGFIRASEYPTKDPKPPSPSVE